MYLPPLELQQNFAEMVDKAHELKRRAGGAATSAAKLSDSLMERFRSLGGTYASGR